MTGETVKPVFNLSDPEKMGAFSALFPLILDTLQSYHRDVELSGDDIVDFLALCIAALHENDTHITSPALMAVAFDNTKIFMSRWVQSLRDQRPPDGDSPSFLAYVLDQDLIERALREKPVGNPTRTQ